MEKSARGEVLSPEQKALEDAKKEWLRIWNTRAKYARRVEQLQRQIDSAKETVTALTKDLKDLEAKVPNVDLGEKKEGV